jgi:GGDEF domain-containing protein
MPDRLGLWYPQTAGDTVPVASWPVPHRHPLLPLGASISGTRQYLLRVENGHSFSAPLVFVSESYLSRSEQRTSLVLGIYFGLAGLAALLATLSAVSLRDAAYGFYALSVVLMGLTQASLTGLAALHLWPNWPWWADVSALLLPVLAVGVVQWFFALVVALRERSRRLDAVVVGLALAAVPLAVVLALVEPSWRIRLAIGYIVVATNVGLIAVIWSTLRGDRYGPWLLAGSIPVALGSVFPLARTAGLIPVSFLTTHGMQIGIAIELPILLVMLMLRSQHRREHLRRIQGLERIDPATGLINAAVFHERLVRLIARSQRLKYRSAVLLVDIVNLEQLRRDFDQQAAEELPLHVAGRLLSTSREIDTVARLSDQRFGILLEGPLKADEVAEAAPRVVARCLMPFKNKPLEWTAQVRVAQGLIPMDGTDPAQLLGQLEALLASVPADSKRAVFLLSRPVTAPAIATAG